MRNARIALAIAACLAIVLALRPQRGLGANKYWDTDGATAGAGDSTPIGTWDATTANWSTSSLGNIATETWTTGDVAFFSAGTDATGAYTVTVSSTRAAGGLNIQEGTVSFAGGTVSLGANPITVSSGAKLSIDNATRIVTAGGSTMTLTGGTVRHTGANGSGGKLAPGNSIESLDVGALAFNSGATFNYEINSGLALNVAADLVNADGDLDIFTGAVLALFDSDSSPLAPGSKFTLISYSGTWNGGIFDDHENGSFVSLGDNTYQIKYDDTSLGSLNFGGGEYNGNVTLTSIAAIPETSSFIFGGLVGITFAAAHFNRKLRRR